MRGICRRSRFESEPEGGVGRDRPPAFVPTDTNGLPSLKFRKAFSIQIDETDSFSAVDLEYIVHRPSDLDRPALALCEEELIGGGLRVHCRQAEQRRHRD